MAEELRYRFTGDPTDLVRANKQVGDSFEDLADDAKQLDHEMAVIRAAMRDTARDIANTADEAERKNLFKVLNRQRRDLGQRVKLRDLIDFDPDEGMKLGARMAGALGEGVSRAGGPIADALGNVFGTLPPQAQAAIGAGIVGAVAVAAPAIGAVVAGAVTGGTAAAGMAAGIALASRDARVKEAADGLGDAVMDSLSRAAAPAFVPPTLRAIARIRTEVRDLDDELGDLFGAAAQHVDPLVDAFVTAGTNAIPQITNAIENAGPVVDAFGDGVVRTADAVADGLEMISGASVGAGEAVEDFFLVLEFGIRTTAATVTGLSYLYEGLKLVFGGLRGQTEVIQEHALRSAEAKDGVDGLAEGFRKIAEEQDDAADAGRDVLDVWNEFMGAVMGSDQALIRYEESWDRLIEELNDGKKTLDINTEAGRNNMGAILDQIGAIDGLYQAGLITDAQYQDHLDTLEATLIKRGFEKTAVQAIIDKYRQIPAQVNTTLTSNAVPAKSRVEAYIESLGDIPSTKTVTIIQRLVTKGVRIAGLTGPGGVSAFSDGGVVEGPRGAGDVVPALLTPEEGVLTVDGLRRLGGEPVLDALNRGTPLPAPAAAGGGRGGTALLERPAVAGGDPGALAREIGRAVRAELAGLRLDLVLDSRHVGEAQARDADRKTRSEW